MAVYTKIQIQDINFIFQQFNGIKSLTGIVEGVEQKIQTCHFFTKP